MLIASAVSTALLKEVRAFASVGGGGRKGRTGREADERKLIRDTKGTL